MDQSYILPFIKSTQNIFSTMFQMDVEVAQPQTRTSANAAHDVSGIIGMSGDVDGSVVLTFPIETARRVCSIFTGADIGDNVEDLSDAVGELVNMIAGGAKAQFDGKNVSISCPSIVIGTQHAVYGRKDYVGILLPCTCDCGEFGVEVSFRQTAATPAPAAAQGA